MLNFEGHNGSVSSLAFSSDGRFAVSGSDDQTIKLWEIATGKVLQTYTVGSEGGPRVTLSPDGRSILADTCDRGDASCSRTSLKLWDTVTGRLLRSIAAQNDNFFAFVFSPDSRFILASDARSSKGALHTFTLWEAATGKALRSFSRYAAPVSSLAFSPDGRYALSGGEDNALIMWDVATGKELRGFSGHSGAIRRVAFSPDGRFAFSGSDDGTARIWDAGKGQEVARMMAAPDGEWFTMTPEGFFPAHIATRTYWRLCAASRSRRLVRCISRSLTPISCVRLWPAIPMARSCMPAEVVSLDKVLDAGPPPNAVVTSHTPGSRSNTGLVTAAAHITDRGKGIGRIEWRVNGVTSGVMAAPSGSGPNYIVTRELALDLGENQIEVIAYEERNLLASPPARTTILYDGPADTLKRSCTSWPSASILMLIKAGRRRAVRRNWRSRRSILLWRMLRLSARKCKRREPRITAKSASRRRSIRTRRPPISTGSSSRWLQGLARATPSYSMPPHTAIL